MDKEVAFYAKLDKKRQDQINSAKETEKSGIEEVGFAWGGYYKWRHDQLVRDAQEVKKWTGSVVASNRWLIFKLKELEEERLDAGTTKEWKQLWVDAMEDVRENFADAVDNMFDSITDKSKKTSEVLKDFLGDIGDSIQRFVAEQAAMKLMEGLFGKEVAGEKGARGQLGGLAGWAMGGIGDLLGLDKGGVSGRSEVGSPPKGVTGQQAAQRANYLALGKAKQASGGFDFWQLLGSLFTSALGGMSFGGTPTTTTGAGDYGNMFLMGRGGYATGGIIDRPQVVMAGERGPEVILPLRRGSARVGGEGGSNVTINATIQAMDSQSFSTFADQNRSTFDRQILSSVASNPGVRRTLRKHMN